MHDFELELLSNVTNGLKIYKALVFRAVYLIVWCDLSQQVQWNQRWNLTEDAGRGDYIILHNTVEYCHKSIQLEILGA